MLFLSSYPVRRITTVSKNTSAFLLQLIASLSTFVSSEDNSSEPQNVGHPYTNTNIGMAKPSIKPNTEQIMKPASIFND
jgi:hypothetical protein